MTVRPILPFALALLLALALAAPADAAPWTPFEGPSAEQAREHLASLEDHLKSRRATNDDLFVDIQVIVADYLAVTPPVAPEPAVAPEGASREERDAVRRANREAEAAHKEAMQTYERTGGKFRAAVERALLKALALERVVRRGGPNLRDEVNIAAARALGSTQNPALGKRIRDVLARSVFRRERAAPPALLDAAFGALAQLNDHDSLAWMAEEFIHTRNSPPRDVDQLVAAHRAMVRFENPPGRLRYEIVDKMLTLYTGTEAQAGQNSNDPAIQAARIFWDRIRNGAIRVVQQFAREPRDADGRGLATMRELRAWFRSHDDRRKAPWLDA